MGATAEASAGEHVEVPVGEPSRVSYPSIAPYGTFPQTQVTPPVYRTVIAEPRYFYVSERLERLPFCGCGLGVFLFLLGFVFPIAWFIGAFVYFCVDSINHDRRERVGLSACTIAAALFTAALFGGRLLMDKWGRQDGGHHRSD